MRTGCHHQVERIKRRQTLGTSKAQDYFLRMFFSKASHCSHSNPCMFLMFYLQPKCYSFLVNDFIAGVTNPQLSALITIFRSRLFVWPFICSVVMGYIFHMTSHFIKLKTLYNTFVAGFQAGVQWAHNHSGWLNIYWIPRISRLAVAKIWVKV